MYVVICLHNDNTNKVEFNNNNNNDSNNIIRHISKIRHILVFRTIMFDFLRQTYKEGIFTGLLIQVGLHSHTQKHVKKNMSSFLTKYNICGRFVYA